MNNTPWRYSVQFINNHVKDNETFSTRDMLNHVRCGGRRSVSSKTLYWHRVILARLGFIEKIKSGLWLKIKYFPYDVGKAEAERVAWGIGWDSWFIPIENRWPLLEDNPHEKRRMNANTRI